MSENSLIDSFRDNALKIIDESGKSGPHYVQTLSNLHLDSIETAKIFTRAAFDLQKHLLSSYNLPSKQVSEVVGKQSADVTANAIRSIELGNQLTGRAMEAMRQSINIFGKTVEKMAEQNMTIMSEWTRYWSQNYTAPPPNHS